MQAAAVLLGVKASRCTASGSHSPMPLRFVWHHIQPHEAGGPTEPGNLVELCDSCHYSVHRLLWQMARGLPVEHAPRVAMLRLATAGYTACMAAGTTGQIPDEG